MQVLESNDLQAVCKTSSGELHRIDMLLVGQQAQGTWLLTFLNTAREVLSDERARQILDALQALEMAAEGLNNFDHLFEDLIEREPQLPDFLKSTPIEKK